MKHLKRYGTLIAILLLTFSLTGCDTTDTTNDGNQQERPYENGAYNDNPYKNSTIPPQQQGIGMDYDLSGYLIPSQTLENKKVYKTFVITPEDSNGYFTQGSTTLTRYYEPVIGQESVNVFQNNSPVERYTFTEAYVYATFIDIESGVETRQTYPRHLQVHGDLYRTEDGACVLQEHLQNFDMADSNLVPVQAKPNGFYGSVLHFHCGTVDGTVIDRYYADGWGVVLEIYKGADGTTTYSVFDQNSYQEN
jgi:hypothetical protein